MAILVSIPLGYAAISLSYSFAFSITDSNGAGDNFDGATAIITDSEDRIIALDNGWRGGHDHRIATFATDGTFLSSFLSGGDISTNDDYYDITTDSEDRIIISDKGFKKIKIFSSDGVNTFNITNADGIGGEFDTPLGVATDSQDRIIVSDSKNSRVQIFDKFGVFELSIGFNDWTSGVTTDSQDRIIVADRDNYRVQIFDKNGTYIAQFGSLGSGDGEFASPRFITTDSQDRILVSDSHHRIQIFENPLDRNTSSGCNSDCKPPSLESFEFNDTSNWLTAKNQTFNIGDKQVMKFVYHENEGIEDINDVEIGFGLPYLGSPMHKSEIILKINTNHGNFTSLEIDDKNKLFYENSTTVNIEQVQCGYNECLEYTLEFVWAEIPFDGYFLITASDDHNNTTYDRNEEPFTVIGKTLNDEPTISLYNRYTSTIKDGLFFDITRIEKVTDMWIDEKDRVWKGLGNDRFKLTN